MKRTFYQWFLAEGKRQYGIIWLVTIIILGAIIWDRGTLFNLKDNSILGMTIFVIIALGFIIGMGYHMLDAFRKQR